MKHTVARRAKTLVWGCCLAGLLFFTPGELRAQAPESLEACGPAPALKAALEQVPERQSPTQTNWQFHEQKLAAIEALRKQYPNDIFVQGAYRGALMYSPEGRDKVFAEFKAHHEQDPSDAGWAYRYADVLIGRHTDEAIKLLNQVLEKAPKFPSPHIALVIIYTSPVFLNKEQAAVHLKAFLEACPESGQGYSWLTRFDDKELILQGAAKLRRVLQSRTDAEALGFYPTLWSLEFKTHSPSEYGALRKQVAADLTRLRALNRQDNPEWYYAMEEGYKLVNDQKQSDWAHDERANRFPSPWELPAMSKWSKDHKWPSSDAPADKKREFYTDLLKQSAEWVKERPNTTYLWSQRAHAAAYLDLPASEIEAAVDKALEVAKANAGPRELDSQDSFNAAEILSEKHLQPERVVDLAERGLARLKIETRPLQDLYATKDDIVENDFDDASSRIYGMRLLADGYLQLKQIDKAQIELAQMDERLQDLKTLAGDKQALKDQATGRESAYWGLMAGLAELQNRKLDAMAFYENALLKRFAARQKPETGVKDDLAENAQALWKSLGGTEEGWKIWYGRPANELAQQASLTWEAANLPLPAFELADLRGTTWQVASLKGKVTFLNFWASW